MKVFPTIAILVFTFFAQMLHAQNDTANVVFDSNDGQAVLTLTLAYSGTGFACTATLGTSRGCTGHVSGSVSIDTDLNLVHYVVTAPGGCVLDIRQFSPETNYFIASETPECAAFRGQSCTFEGGYKVRQ